MTKQVTTRGAMQAGVDVLFMTLFFIGSFAGILHASVLQDMTLWFYYAAGAFLLLKAVELLFKVTKPADNYDVISVPE